MNLIFLTYNNYYNRIVKREETKTAYETVAGLYSQELYDIQFNPNDGVMAEQIVNWSSKSWTPDYMLYYDETNNVILSRWFVLEWVRTRGGQYKATLYRDLVADHLPELYESPIFVEKATVPYASDPAVYNMEEMATNQIKSDEFLLKDKSQSSWLVGYFAKNAQPTSSEITIPNSIVPAITVNTLASWDYNQYINQDYKAVEDFNITTRFSLGPGLGKNAACRITTKGDAQLLANSLFTYYYTKFSDVPTGAENRLYWVRQNLLTVLQSNTETIKQKYHDDEGFQFTNDLTSLDGKTLFVESGAGAGYYTIKVVDNGYGEEDAYYDKNSSWTPYINGLFSSVSGYDYSTTDRLENVKRYIKYKKYRIVLESTYNGALKMTWQNTFRKLSDAPYGMFAIPYDAVDIQASDGTYQLTTISGDSALNIAVAISEALGANNVYDLQRLPYFPYQDMLYANGVIRLRANANYAEHVDYEYIYDDNTVNKKSIMFLFDTSSFEFNVTKSLTIPQNYFTEGEEVIAASDVENKKIANQCDMYRLYSPNWAASFDFNLAKTNEINGFKIYCTYKPYNPFIHVRPNWSGLYGTQEYDDYRGLICQGDFAIPMITDAWQTYQVNNKNYLNAFNRQVQSIELNNSVQYKKDVFGAIAGTVTGGAAGALAGSRMGVPGGAIGGAIAGGIASGVGGIMDVHYNELLRNEALDLTKDQFGYNLQNIQALPDTLAKVSTFDKNNAIWPVLEYYTCTQTEKVALHNKFKYNGMTIMRIGTLSDYALSDDKQYFKGRLIRCESVQDDYHILTALADELNKGVFI